MNLEKQQRRHAHLAQAYRRGIPYRVLELTTRPDNLPNPIELFQALAGKKRRADLKNKPKDEFEITLAPLIAWLNQPAPAQRVTSQAVQREHYIAAKNRRRAEYKAQREADALVANMVQ